MPVAPVLPAAALSHTAGLRVASAPLVRRVTMDNSTAGALLWMWLLGAPLVFALVSKFTGR